MGGGVGGGVVMADVWVSQFLYLCGAIWGLSGGRCERSGVGSCSIWSKPDSSRQNRKGKQQLLEAAARPGSNLRALPHTHTHTRSQTRLTNSTSCGAESRSEPGEWPRGSCPLLRSQSKVRCDSVNTVSLITAAAERRSGLTTLQVSRADKYSRGTPTVLIHFCINKWFIKVVQSGFGVKCSIENLTEKVFTVEVNGTWRLTCAMPPWNGYECSALPH